MFLTIPNFFCEFVAKPLIKLGVSLMTLNTVQITSIAQAMYYFAILYFLTKYIVNMKQNVTIKVWLQVWFLKHVHENISKQCKICKYEFLHRLVCLDDI